jgi:hypothetical protein
LSQSAAKAEWTTYPYKYVFWKLFLGIFCYLSQFSYNDFETIHRVEITCCFWGCYMLALVGIAWGYKLFEGLYSIFDSIRTENNSFFFLVSFCFFYFDFDFKFFWETSEDPLKLMENFPFTFWRLQDLLLILSDRFKQQ